MMRLALVLSLVITAALPAQAPQVRGARAASTVAIRLHVPAGTVEVIGWDRDSVALVATPARGTSVDGGGTLQGMKFAAELRNPRDTGLATARVRLHVPRMAKVWLKSTTASLATHGVYGEVDFLTVSGSASVESGSGILRVESIEGDVTARRMDGIIRVRGGSGNVQLDAVTGTLDIATIGGAVGVTRVTAPSGGGPPGTSLSGHIETIGGRVTVGGAPGSGGLIEIATHSGDIRILTSGAKAPRLVAEAHMGPIAPAFRAGDPAFGEFRVRSFKGTLNAEHWSGI